MIPRLRVLVLIVAALGGHHDHWDGGGYPHGLRGDAIPLLARICAIVDMFDALTTSRPYRAALPFETAVGLMRAQRGRQLDPDVLDAFLRHRGAFAVAMRDLTAGERRPAGDPPVRGDRSGAGRVAGPS